jgi:Zn-dependent protease
MALSVARRVAPLPRIGTLRAAGGVAALVVEVRPDISCLLAIGLSAWTFADTILPAAAPGRSAALYWATGIVTATALVTSLALQEVGHAIAGRRVGLMPRSIALSLFGGATIFDREPDTPGAACRVAMAGPLANLVAALVAGIVHIVLVELDADPLAASVAASIAVMNVGIATVNLTPVPPLDGGHLFRGALAFAIRRPDIAAALSASAGRLLGWALLGVAVLASASGDVAIALWAALIGLAVHDHTRAAEPRPRALDHAAVPRVARRPAA